MGKSILPQLAFLLQVDPEVARSLLKVTSSSVVVAFRIWHVYVSRRLLRVIFTGVELDVDRVEERLDLKVKHSINLRGLS